VVGGNPYDRMHGTPPLTGADTRAVQLVRRRVVVRGRVQGVWFRESARRRAEGLGVAGWVRNRWDGTVEAEVEGPVEAVDALVAWLGEGPPRARVDGIDVEDRAPLGEDGFDVR
jgi:acylphosphatase